MGHRSLALRGHVVIGRPTKDCANQCGRRTYVERDQCYHCARGRLPEASIRWCACGNVIGWATVTGLCRSCRANNLHAAGVLGKGKTRKDVWIPAEDDAIRKLAGKHTAEEIGKDIGRATASVHWRARRLGISLQLDFWSLQRVAHLFGFEFHSAKRAWVDTGLLPARKIPGRGRFGGWRIEEQDIEGFIRRCPWAYDANRMVPRWHRLTQLAKSVQRRDPWVLRREAAEYLGVPPLRLTAYCAMGLIPHERSHTTGITGGVGGQLIFRVADLPAAKVAIEKYLATAYPRRAASLRAWNAARQAAAA